MSSWDTRLGFRGRLQALGGGAGAQTFREAGVQPGTAGVGASLVEVMLPGDQP